MLTGCLIVIIMAMMTIMKTSIQAMATIMETMIILMLISMVLIHLTTPQQRQTQIAQLDSHASGAALHLARHYWANDLSMALHVQARISFRAINTRSPDCDQGTDNYPGSTNKQTSKHTHAHTHTQTHTHTLTHMHTHTPTQAHKHARATYGDKQLTGQTNESD